MADVFQTQLLQDDCVENIQSDLISLLSNDRWREWVDLLPNSDSNSDFDSSMSKVLYEIQNGIITPSTLFNVYDRNFLKSAFIQNPDFHFFIIVLNLSLEGNNFATIFIRNSIMQGYNIIRSFIPNITNLLSELRLHFLKIFYGVLCTFKKDFLLDLFCDFSLKEILPIMLSELNESNQDLCTQIIGRFNLTDDELEILRSFVETAANEKNVFSIDFIVSLIIKGGNKQFNLPQTVKKVFNGVTSDSLLVSIVSRIPQMPDGFLEEFANNVNPVLQPPLRRKLQIKNSEFTNRLTERKVLEFAKQFNIKNQIPEKIHEMAILDRYSIARDLVPLLEQMIPHDPTCLPLLDALRTRKMIIKQDGSFKAKVSDISMDSAAVSLNEQISSNKPNIDQFIQYIKNLYQKNEKNIVNFVERLNKIMNYTNQMKLSGILMDYISRNFSFDEITPVCVIFLKLNLSNKTIEKLNDNPNEIPILMRLHETALLSPTIDFNWNVYINHQSFSSAYLDTMFVQRLKWHAMRGDCPMEMSLRTPFSSVSVDSVNIFRWELEALNPAPNLTQILPQFNEITLCEKLEILLDSKRASPQILELIMSDIFEYVSSKEFYLKESTNFDILCRTGLLWYFYNDKRTRSYLRNCEDWAAKLIYEQALSHLELIECYPLFLYAATRHALNMKMERSEIIPVDQVLLCMSGGNDFDNYQLVVSITQMFTEENLYPDSESWRNTHFVFSLLRGSYKKCLDQIDYDNSMLKLLLGCNIYIQGIFERDDIDSSLVGFALYCAQHGNFFDDPIWLLFLSYIEQIRWPTRFADDCENVNIFIRYININNANVLPQSQPPMSSQ